MENEAGVGLEKLTRVYLKIKAKRSELAAKFKEEDGGFVLPYCEDAVLDERLGVYVQVYRGAGCTGILRETSQPR